MSEQADITGLIERVTYNKAFVSDTQTGEEESLVALLQSERDTIVLALRVLRVRRHPMCQQVRFGSYGGFEFSILPTTAKGDVADSWAYAQWMDLDEAERILGIADGDK